MRKTINSVLFSFIYIEDKDCADIYKNGKTESGVYQIDPDGKGNFNVFCDMTT